MIDLDELERLADAATAGPWFVSGPPWFDDRTLVFAGDADPHRGRFVTDTGDPGFSPPRPVADAAFIAAANPSTVKALIARIRELEGTR